MMANFTESEFVGLGLKEYNYSMDPPTLHIFVKPVQEAAAASNKNERGPSFVTPSDKGESTNIAGVGVSEENKRRIKAERNRLINADWPTDSENGEFITQHPKGRLYLYAVYDLVGKTVRYGKSLGVHLDPAEVYSASCT
jgi:hypothetical protein